MYNMLSMHLLSQLHHMLCMCYLLVSCPNFFFSPSLSCLHPFFVVSVITRFFMFLKCPVQSLTRDQRYLHFITSVCPAAGPTVAFLTMIMQVLWSNVLILMFLLFSLLPPPHLLLDVWVLNVILIACKTILVTKFSRQYFFSLTVSHVVYSTLIN
jgi:hypothetical protein